MTHIFYGINITDNLSINESGGTDTYNVIPSTLSGDVNITLPILVANDTFVFEDHIQTLTNKTLTSPRIGTSILDTSGNELFLLTATGSAVNEFTITNAASGTNPTISASGDNTNIGINITSKGTGTFNFAAGSASDSAEIRLEDDTGGEYIGIKANATTTSYSLTMPAAQGANEFVLLNNGSGVLSWRSISPAVDTAVSEGTSTTTSTGFMQKLRLTFTALAATYKIGWYCEMSSSDSSAKCVLQIQEDDTTTHSSVDFHPETSNNEGFGPASGFVFTTLTAASHDFDLDFASSIADKEISIRRARLVAMKVS